MGKTIQKYLVAVVLLCSVIVSTSAYAAFEKFNSLPGIVICEVKSYGEVSLKQEFLTTFEELLAEKIQESGKFRVEQRMVLSSAEKALLKEMHMNTIVNSRNFIREESSMDLVHYNDGLPKKEKNKKDIHFTKGYLKTKMREVSNAHNAKYLFFCNVKMIDVVLKNPTADLDEKSLKDMKLKMAVDYYLVNTETGKVFAGTSFIDKTTQVVDLVFAKHGKRFTVQQLLHAILESQANRVVDNIAHDGFNKVSGDDFE